MNIKKNTPKPKSNIKTVNSPQQQAKSPISALNTHPTSQSFHTPTSKAQPQPVKKLMAKEAIQKSKRTAQIIVINSSSSSSLSGSQISKQQLLYLQIKHLKQENRFLKKKIQELTAELEPYSPRKKTKAKEKGHHLPNNIQSLHLSVTYFFKEINNLLGTITRLFKLTLNEDQISGEMKPQSLQKVQCPLQREFLYRKYLLNRKLQKISLEEEEKKYSTLLDVFIDYYRYKEEAEHKILENLDKMIVKTADLNKYLLEKAQMKKLKSEVYSRANLESIGSPQKPFGFKASVDRNRNTLSPNPKNALQYKRCSDLSP